MTASSPAESRVGKSISCRDLPLIHKVVKHKFEDTALLQKQTPCMQQMLRDFTDKDTTCQTS